MEIYLVRHGESQSNVDRSILLQKDFFDNFVSLTDKGKNQAFEAGKEFKEIRSLEDEDSKKYLYFSPYLRAVETKNEILKSNKFTQEIEHPLLIEQEFKDFKDQEEVKLKKERRNVRGKFYYRYKNGESPLDVFLRTTTFLNEIKLNHSSKDSIVIVSHEVVIRCILHSLLKLDINSHLKMDIPNASVIGLDSYDNLNWEVFYCLDENLNKIIGGTDEKARN